MHTHPNHLLARGYGESDVPVFPTCPHGPRIKQPLVSGGFTAATQDVRHIDVWWRRWPDALVAIPTDPRSGVWVLDVDGDAGRQSLSRLLAELGLETPFDLTPIICRTPSGGLHLYFRLRPGERPRTRAGDIAPGLDTRGVKADGSAGGYVIAPGCVLPDGRRYELIGPASLLAGDIAP